MARKVRNAELDTRTARSRLRARGKPYYCVLDAGLHLGYRKNKASGRWLVRRYIGDQAYVVESLDGIADDTQDADGIAVLSFAQAQAQARSRFVAAKRNGAASPLTVRKACEDYVAFLLAERKSANDAAGRLAKHVYPKIGDKLVIELTTSDVEAVKRGMVRHDKADPEVERRSRDTANRILAMLKAALNRAFRDEDNAILSDNAWRRVVSFKDVARAREVHLDVEQSRRLVNATEGQFRRLVTAALLTGARTPGELANARVHDFHAEVGTLTVDGKTGRRDIVLTREAIAFFRDMTAGRDPDALLIPKDDGTHWGKSHHTRPMKEAVARAELPKATVIYSLRHTYASQSILAGINLQLLAENMGTSIRMIEQHYGKFVAASRRKLVEESAFKLGLKNSNLTKLRVLGV